MKRIIFALFLSGCTAAALFAQDFFPVHIRDVSVEKDQEVVRLSFFLAVDPVRTGSLHNRYTPVITDGTHRVSLSSLVVRRPGAERAWNRHEWSYEFWYPEEFRNAVPEDSRLLVPGDTIWYHAEVPFQCWMHDSRVELEILQLGCGEAYLETAVLLPAILPAPVPQPIAVVVERPVPNLGEQLAEVFSFVLPAADFDPDEPIRFYDDERDNALTVYYQINRFDIEPQYLDNHRTLMNLMAAIRIISESFDAQVERVVVAGFASPEGPFAFNDRLAWERAVSVKEYILQNSGLEDRSIAVFNGSADWRGLRLQVLQHDALPAREQVLDILENKKEEDRIPAIRQLDSGAAYRYLAEHIFPKLRNGAFIRVYYENRD